MKSTVKADAKLFILFALVPLFFFGCATKKTQSSNSSTSKLPVAYQKDVLRNKKLAAKNQGVASSKRSAYEELTGRTDMTKISAPKKALSLARESRSNKDYIMAIKRYNFIIKNFPKSAEAKQALLDKSSMYSQMGLKDQAQYNKQRAIGATQTVAIPPAKKALKKTTAQAPSSSQGLVR